MALPAVQDLLDGWPGRATLELDSGVETSGQGSGQLRVKAMRDARWMLDASTPLLRPSAFAYWKGRVNALKNGERLFYGYDLRGKYPAAYPNASWPTGGAFNGLTAKIKSIGSNGVSVALEDLPPNFALGVGDKFSAEYGSGEIDPMMLLEVSEAAIADGSGDTAEFECQPPVPFGASTGATVRLIFPRCHMMIEPGSVKATPDDLGWGTVSFQGRQVITP